MGVSNHKLSHIKIRRTQICGWVLRWIGFNFTAPDRTIFFFVNSGNWALLNNTCFVYSTPVQTGSARRFDIAIIMLNGNRRSSALAIITSVCDSAGHLVLTVRPRSHRHQEGAWEVEDGPRKLVSLPLSFAGGTVISMFG